MTGHAAKNVLRSIAAALILPAVASMWLRSLLVGRDKAFQGSTEWLAQVPGLTGEYLRRAFLGWASAGCGPDAVIGIGTIFSTARVRLDGNAYVGPQCNIGWAHIERDALLASGVHVPSGPDTHGTSRLDIPMREQPGTPRQVRIGEGAWIGNAAVIMADVGRHAIVGAGAVVTKPIPDFAVAAGVPARVLKSRRDPREVVS
jgi:acetyltransferase-like isoleucine patch superfamily enzyme